MRTFHRFSYRDADYRISASNLTAVTDTIIKQRDILEDFVLTNQNFLNSLVPLPALPEYSPVIAGIMQKAATLANVGPMAAVAGTIAQLGAEEGSKNTKEHKEAIVENGGDIFMVLNNELILGIHSDVEALRGKLAFRIRPEDTPLAVCSSSGTMGHSLSLGNYNLATVFSKSGALADAAATRACNIVKDAADIQCTLDEISAIPGIIGLMIIKGNSVGMAGDLPEIISNADPEMMNKITRHHTNGSYEEGKVTDSPQGLKLQAEGYEVLYRNIWIQELKLKKASTLLR